MRKSAPTLRAVMIPVLLALAPLTADPEPVRAQVLPALAGGVGGFVAGAWTAVGIYVARARMGQFIFNMNDISEPRMENLPIVVFPLTGILMGATSDRLDEVGVGAGLGVLTGGAVGALLGSAMTELPDGKWAGAIIGSAAGLVVGAVVGGATGGGENIPSGAQVPMFSVRVPIGGMP